MNKRSRYAWLHLDVLFAITMLAILSFGFYKIAEEVILYDYSYHGSMLMPEEDAIKMSHYGKIKITETESGEVYKWDRVVACPSDENVYIKFNFESDEYGLYGLPCQSITGLDKFIQYIFALFFGSFSVIVVYFLIISLFSATFFS